MRPHKTTRTSIEVTDACNLFCSACKTPHGNNFMTPETFTALAVKLRGHITHLALHWRGEPCLHPLLPELAQISREHGFSTWLSTNTAVPNLSKHDYVKRLLDNLDWIEICVDGYDEDTAGRYRVGANWKQIKSNLETISNVETDCAKTMRVLMFRYNDGKEDIYREMAKKYAMDELIFAQPLIGLKETINRDEANEWLSANPKYQRYHQRGDIWRRSTGRCGPNPIISVHGTVHPCGLDWELKHPIGNLLTEKRWENILTKYRNVAPQLGTQEMCELCCIPGQNISFREKIISGEAS